jgi:hemoglobin/transferrin/lactoferrin receptor protein
MVRRDFTLNGQDSIFYDGLMSKVEALQNAESATIWGANFSFEWIISNSLRTQHDLTITTGEDSEGFPLRHVPPTFGSSHLIYEKQKLYLDLYACYSDKLDFEDLAPDEQDKPHLYLPDENGNPYSPAWWTLNIKSNYKISQNLTLGGGIENILDKRYRPYSSGVVSPGINFIFSILLKI